MALAARMLVTWYNEVTAMAIAFTFPCNNWQLVWGIETIVAAATRPSQLEMPVRRVGKGMCVNKEGEMMQPVEWVMLLLSLLLFRSSVV